MADESLNPKEGVGLNRLEETIQRVQARVTAEVEQARKESAADARKTQAAVREGQRARAAGPTAAGPTEKAAIDEATLSTRSLVRAQADALKTAQARVAIEEKEGQILARNAETLRAAGRVRSEYIGAIPVSQPSPTLQAATRVQNLHERDLRIAAQRAEAEVQSARWQAIQEERSQQQVQAPLAQRLLGPGATPYQALLSPPRRGVDLSAALGAAQAKEAAANTATAAKATAAANQEAIAAEEKRVLTQTRLAEVNHALEGSEVELRRATEFAARAHNLAGDAARRHGLLTSETIGYMVKGQVSARQFGEEILGTIGKFGGWTAAATLTYGAVRVMDEFYQGALKASSGVGLVSRVLQNVDSSKLQQSFRDLSAQFNVPIGDAVDAVYGSAKAFNTQEDAVTAAGTALYAMKVGELSAAQATQYLTAIVYGFGLQANELPAVFDAINQAQNKFGGNVGQITAGVAKAAGVFKLAGGNYTDLIALIETGTKLTGATGENVGTAIARSASRVLTPQGGQALRAVGITPGRGYEDILAQAFELAQRGSAEQVNAIARALVPAGGQFARIFTPILQNQALYNRVQAQVAPDQARGSAARELSKALSQPDEQIKALYNGIERLGAAFAQAGGGTGLGLLVRTLNLALTAATKLVEAFGKIPGIHVAAPFLELYGVMRAMRFFNVGGSLPFAAPGSFRGRIQGLVTESPERTIAKTFAKDTTAELRLVEAEGMRLAASGHDAAQLAEVRRKQALAENLTEEEQLAAGEVALAANRRSADFTQRIAENDLRRARILGEDATFRSVVAGGGLPSEARRASGRMVVTPSYEAYGKGGPPLEVIPPIAGGAGPEATAVAAGEGAIVATRVAAIEKVNGTERVGAEVRVSAAERTVAVEKETSTARVAAAVEGDAAILETDKGFWAARVAIARAGAAAALEGSAGRAITAGAVTGAGVAGATARGVRGGIGAAGALAHTGVGAIPIIGTTIFAAHELYDQYTQYGKSVDEFRKAANAGQVNLAKTIALGKAEQARNAVTAGTIAKDILSLDPGALYKHVTSSIGSFLIHGAADLVGVKYQDAGDIDREVTKGLALELAHEHMAQGAPLTKDDLEAIGADAAKKAATAPRVGPIRTGPYSRPIPDTRPSPEMAGIFAQLRAQAQTTGATWMALATPRAVPVLAPQVGTSAPGAGSDLTQKQISQRRQQALSAAGDWKEQIAAWQQVIEEEATSKDSTIPSPKARQRIRAAITEAKAAIALIKANQGDLAELAKVLADGSLDVATLTAQIQTQVQAFGVTPHLAREARLAISQSVVNYGVADFGSDPAGQAKALKDAEDNKKSLQDDANTQLQASLATAKTPQQFDAAYTTYRKAIRASYAGFLDGVHQAQKNAAADEAALASGNLSPAQALAKTIDLKGQKKAVRDGLKVWHKQLTEMNSILGPDVQQQVQQDFGSIDVRANYQASLTSDPTVQARIKLTAINQKVREMIRLHLVGTDEWYQLLTEKHQEQQADADNQISDFEAKLAASTSAANIGATQGAVLNRALGDAKKTLAFIKTHGGTVKQIADAQTAVNQATGAVVDFVRDQAKALIDANFAYRESGTEDPVKLAKLARDNAIADAQFARTEPEKRAAAADVRNKQTAYRNAKIQDSLDTINFNLDMGRIDKSTAAAEILALSKRRGISKQVRRDLLRQYHQLTTDAQGDSSGYELDIGNIKIPTPYEVMRGIHEAHRRTVGTTSAGNVHATSNATINVVVNNRGDVGAVADAIDGHLSTHVRSALRTRGVLRR